MSWDPDQYLCFESERALPFRHLVAAVDHLEPSSIVDLGCGPGGLTAGLLKRWPDARITGVDASEEMIERAGPHAIPGKLEFEIGDVLAWRVPEPVDLMLSNAYFHVLEGEDPVLEWVRGTTLRPVLERLPEDEHADFLGAYGSLLRASYQSRDGKKVFPFKRSFVVASKS